MALEPWPQDGILGALRIYCVVQGMLLDIVKGYKCSSLLAAGNSAEGVRMWHQKQVEGQRWEQGLGWG